MPSREEIGKGIKDKLMSIVWDCNYPTLDECYKIANEYLEFLHSQGVVLKVDRELPIMPPATDEELKARYNGKCRFIRHGEFFNTWFCGLTGETSKTMEFCEKWNGGSCSPQKGIDKFRAGYVAVEPLIKENEVPTEAIV